MSSEVISTFYNTTAREWIRASAVGQSHGATMLTMLDEEYDRITANPINNFGVLAYGTQLNEVYKIAADAMMSSVHRSVFHYHVNHGLSGSQFRVPSDEEELTVSSEPLDDTEDDEDDDSLSSMEEPKKAPIPSSSEVKARKREEAKKRRVEDEQLLVKDRKVRDEKNNLMSTVGPFPPPRLTIRSIKPGRAIPSRKSLTQRATLDSSDSSSDTDEENSTALAAAATSSTTADADTSQQLTNFLQPLSLDSLKKLSESAKVKLRGNCPHDEAVSDIVKTAVKLGCEKACMLMDKNKMLDKVAAHAHTSRTHILGHLATSIPSFLSTLSDDILRSLGPTLGIPNENATVNEMWERIVAMGFCAVLTHLRPRPLKKMAQELTIQLSDSGSTEKHCEQVVFTAFPRERLRMKQSKWLKRTPGVNFRMISPAHCVGDMGFIGFSVQNVSTMRADSERHYSPEFEFASLKWSLLCMSNKDSLALYLCQQGTVHCKFIIAVVNSNEDDSVFNEGTQKFSSASAENDWGFNNVVKFDFLLDAKNGFWSVENDSITIEVGIVLVEPNAKGSSSVINAQPTKAETKSKKQQAAEDQRAFEQERERLLQSEKLEALRKKVRADLNKTQKEEEKLRKEIQQQWNKSRQQVSDQASNDRNRITREQQERERKEQQERQRELERLRQLQEQNQEMQRKLDEFTEESAELSTRKKQLTSEMRDAKKQLEQLNNEQRATDKELAAMEAELAKAEATLRSKEEANAAAKAEVAEIRASIPEAPAPKMKRGGAAASSQEDVEILRSVQQSLAGIVDGF